MARTSQEQRAESIKEEARQATHQALERRRAPPVTVNPFMSPFGLMSALLGDMDRMVRRFGVPTPFLFRPGFGALLPQQTGARGDASAQPAWAPTLEVLTRDGDFVVRAEIPGIDKEHISVEIDEGRAIISGEREEEREEKGEGFFRTERSYGRFSRVVTLPEGANAEEAKAISADGVLEIVIPMASAEPKAHRLEIHEGSTSESGNGAERQAEEPSQAHGRRAPRAERKRKAGR